MGDFKPLPSKELHKNFLEKVVELLFNTVVFTTRKDKVLLWRSPEDLLKEFDFELGQNGESQEKLIQVLKNTVKFSVKTGHPYFVNQLFSGLDPYGLAAQWLTDALNASVYTYEVAPVFTLMEQHVINEVCKMVGLEWGDGMFCPGGSFGNGTAINLARFSRFPQVKKSGSKNLPDLVMFTSEECHYSIFKFASFLGLGEEAVIKLKTDEVGKIVPDDLEQNIIKYKDKNVVPLMVVATMGTTVRGAFDPVAEISAICKKHGLWLHVDAAWGGGLLFSQRYRTKLNGIELADSIVINPHKLLAVPQQCSLLLVRDKNLLHSCHSRGAEYLFQRDKYYDSKYDVGDKYLQCGRKCDVFKFWFMWKAKVAPQIKMVMANHGSVMLNYQPLKSLPNFFRFVSQNSSLTRNDIDFILDHIAEIGDALFLD
ncbi:glutamate decarboxylase 1-like isoform X2 [Sitophilus oryzae]|uniref:Glutamate decarboxylase 1-like isoform X2 n=1 Tax=Sitophilus oryzae TaxID=7048 RepID=A0A6J2YPD1_SITOR|nr:glutamate decarboxylase 1-like isoform X2 [Sitophilus oryzae]